MLPSAHLLSKCLRCHAPLSISDATCKACGADPAVELRIYEQGALAIIRLRHFFLIALVAAALIAVETYRLLGAAGAGPLIADACVMGLLWLAAPRAPVACALIGIAMFGAGMIAFVAASPLAPMALLGDLRVIAVSAAFLFGLGVALHQALTARRLRAQQLNPASVARAA